MTTPHVSTLLARGLLAGLVAALAAFVFAQVIGEPQVDKAIAYEEAHAPAPEAGHEEPETVTRDVQSTWGLGLGVFLVGLALGGVYALVFAFANGRIKGVGTRWASSCSRWSRSSSTRPTRPRSVIPTPSGAAPCCTCRWCCCRC
jgi:hypothetical protein